MFKKFTIEENVSSTSQVKNSVQRSIQAQIISQYPLLEPLIDEILPKKQMILAKCQGHIQLVTVNDEILFFNERDGPFFPTLKLLHKCKY
jgi:malignant T-cell-amplified sequence